MLDDVIGRAEAVVNDLYAHAARNAHAALARPDLVDGRLRRKLATPVPAAVQSLQRHVQRLEIERNAARRLHERFLQQGHPAAVARHRSGVQRMDHAYQSAVAELERARTAVGSP